MKDFNGEIISGVWLELRERGRETGTQKAGMLECRFHSWADGQWRTLCPHSPGEGRTSPLCQGQGSDGKTATVVRRQCGEEGWNPPTVLPPPISCCTSSWPSPAEP